MENQTQDSQPSNSIQVLDEFGNVIKGNVTLQEVQQMQMGGTKLVKLNENTFKVQVVLKG